MVLWPCVLCLPCHRHMFVTVAVGLWGGLLIGLQTEYFTSNRYKPVQVRNVAHKEQLYGS